MLPPLANLFAVYRDDPAVLEAIAVDLQASGEYAQVWRPAPGWVAAAAPLPGGRPDSATIRATGFAFAEGRDHFESGASADAGEPLANLAHLVDRTPERLASLPGDFGFLRIRADSGATIVRSCGGLAPFYLWQSGPNVAVSTRLGEFVRYLPEELALDPMVNALWTTGHAFFPDRRTFLAGVTLLNRGCVGIVQPGRAVNVQAYWHPRAGRLSRPTAAAVRQHAERLRALLVGALGRDLASDGGNLLSLSGGVDSSSLAVLAAGVVGRPVWTWSLLPGREDLFQNEMSYIQPLVSRFRIERSWSVRMSRPAILNDALREAPSVVFHVIHPALCALPAIVNQAPVQVLFGGEFADEVCGAGGTTPDWMAHTSLVDLMSGLSRLPSGPKDVLRWAKHAVLEAVKKPRLPFPSDLPTFIRQDVRDEYRAWFRRRRAVAADDRLCRRYLALCGEADGFVTMNWEATSALRVRRSFPFFNREVLELAFGCHPDELVGPGPKKLLRAALSGDVPERNLNRQDKGGWGVHLRMKRADWHERLPAALATIVRHDWLPAPPTELGFSEARGLQQLLVFTQSVERRQSARRPS